MPIISELKARAAWARHPDEHVALCTVLGGGVPRARAQKLQSGFRSLGFLSCKGHHSQSWGPGHTPGAWPLIPGLCSEKACSRPHYTEALIARVTWTPACALHLRRVSASLRPSSATQPQPLPCAAARRRSGFPPQPGRGMAHGQERSPPHALGNGSQEAGLLLLLQEHEILIPL